MKLPLDDYGGMPAPARNVTDTKMLDAGARESAARTTGTPNYNRSEVKHGSFGPLGAKGFAGKNAK